MRQYRNIKQRYAIVDSKGKVLAKFRQKLTALCSIPKLKLNKSEKLRVVEIEEK